MIRPGRHAQVLRNSEPRWRLPKRLHDFSLGVGQLPYGCPAPSLLGIRLATQASPLWGNRSQAMRVCQKVPTPRPGGWNLELGHVSGPLEMCRQLSGLDGSPPCVGAVALPAATPFLAYVLYAERFTG